MMPAVCVPDLEGYLAPRIWAASSRISTPYSAATAPIPSMSQQAPKRWIGTMSRMRLPFGERRNPSGPRFREASRVRRLAGSIMKVAGSMSQKRISARVRWMHPAVAKKV